MLHGMRRLTALAICVLGLVLLQAANASASAFKVTPVRVTFSGPSSTLLTLKNDSNQPLRFQITAFAWQQDPKGEVKLQPSDDIAFFPALLTLGPGEERKVRVASTVGADQVEKTYRIFFEELPDMEKPQTSGAQVKILTKMGIPIFVEPAKGYAQASIENVTLKNGTIAFDVRNSGTVHFALEKVKVRGMATDGSTAFEQELDGWYVLAGSPRTYDVEVPAEACRKITSVSVQADTDITSLGNAGTVTKTFEVAPGGCK